jgi:Kef-type K+ transport system membrane component KefB
MKTTMKTTMQFILAACLAGGTAYATAASSSVHHSEMLLYFVLLQLIVIVLAGRIGSVLALKFNQNAAVGEIIVGILLGPSLMGWLAPETFQYVFKSVSAEPLTVLSQVGLLLLMFQIGLEFDFGHLTEKRNRKAVIWVSLVGVVAPFLLGLGFGYASWGMLSPKGDQTSYALFIGTAFSITALPILGRILIDLEMTRHPLGVIAISAAAVSDVAGWLLLALVTTLTMSQFDATSFAMKVFLVGIFFIVSWFFVRPLLKRIVNHYGVKNDVIHPTLLGVLLVIIFLGGITTYQLGIFAIFGGFMMGVVLHDETALVRAWKDRIGSFVTVFFLPIFFTYTGLRTNIGGLNSADLWLWCTGLITLAFAGKYFGGYLASRFAGLAHTESKIVGILMNTRALMELIVINVGYDLGVISQNVFTMLVLMAVLSTVITTPLVRRWLAQIKSAK